MPSTVIRSYNYDMEKRRLRVVYLSGMVYDYLEVPESVYLEMKNAFAKGNFLNAHVKGKYEFEKIKNNDIDHRK